MFWSTLEPLPTLRDTADEQAKLNPTVYFDRAASHTGLMPRSGLHLQQATG